MNKKVLRNKAFLMSHAIDRKKMYKVGSQWVIGSALVLLLAGGASLAHHATANADKVSVQQPVNQGNTNSSTKAIQNNSQHLANRIMKSSKLTSNGSNQTQSAGTTSKQHTSSSQPATIDKAPVSNPKPTSNQSNGSVPNDGIGNSNLDKTKTTNSNSTSGSANSNDSNASASNNSIAKITSSAPINQKGSYNSAYDSYIAQMSGTDYKVASMNAVNVQSNSDKKNIKKPLIKDDATNYFSGGVIKSDSDCGLHYKVYKNGGVEFTGGIANSDLSDFSYNINTLSPTNYYLNNAKAIKFDSDIDTSKVTNMFNMFMNDGNVSSISGLGNWNTSNVTNMADMFMYDTSLSSISDLGNWNTSNVTNMADMFMYDFDLSSISGLGNWNTSNVTNMADMFNGSALSSISGLGNWNTSNVTNMEAMFYSSALSSISGLGNWNTSNVTNMMNMFYNDNKLVNTTPISNWSIDGNGTPNGDNVNNSHGSVQQWSSNDQTSVNFKYYDIDSNKYVGQGQRTGYNGKTVQVGSYPESLPNGYITTNSNQPVTYGNSAPYTVDVRELPVTDTVKFHDIYSDVDGMKSPSNTETKTSLPSKTYTVSAPTGWALVNSDGSIDSGTNDVNNDSKTFTYGQGSQTLNVAPEDDGLTYKYNKNTGSLEFTGGTAKSNLSNFSSTNKNATISNAKAIKFNKGVNTSKVTNMSNMFIGDNLALTSIDFSNFNTSNVTNMSGMFLNSPNLKSVKMPNSSTGKNANMLLMFDHDSDLTSINLSNFDTSNVTSMAYMFKSDPKLQSITIQSPKTKLRNSDYLPIMYKKDSNDNYTSPTSNDFSKGNIGTFVTTKNVPTDTINYRLNGNIVASQKFTASSSDYNGNSYNNLDVTSSNATNIPSSDHLVNPNNSFSYDGGTYNVSVAVNSVTTNGQFNYTNQHGSNVNQYTPNRAFSISGTPNQPQNVEQQANNDRPNGYSLASGNQINVDNNQQQTQPINVSVVGNNISDKPVIIYIKKFDNGNPVGQQYSDTYHTGQGETGNTFIINPSQFTPTGYKPSSSPVNDIFVPNGVQTSSYTFNYNAQQGTPINVNYINQHGQNVGNGQISGNVDDTGNATQKVNVPSNYTLNNEQNLNYHITTNQQTINLNVTGQPAKVTFKFNNQHGQYVGSDTVNAEVGDTVSPSSYPKGYTPKSTPSFTIHNAGSNTAPTAAVQGESASQDNGSNNYTPKSDSNNINNNTAKGYATVETVKYSSGQLVSNSYKTYDENNVDTGDSYKITPQNIANYTANANQSLTGTVKSDGSLSNGYAKFIYQANHDNNQISVQYKNQDGNVVATGSVGGTYDEKGTINSLPTTNNINNNYTLNNNVDYQINHTQSPLVVVVTGKPASATINFTNQNGKSKGNTTVNGKVGDTVSPTSNQYPQGYQPNPAPSYTFNNAGNNQAITTHVKGQSASALNGSGNYTPKADANDVNNNAKHGYATVETVKYSSDQLVSNSYKTFNENNVQVGNSFTLSPQSITNYTTSDKPVNEAVNSDGSLSNNGFAKFVYNANKDNNPIHIQYINQDGTKISSDNIYGTYDEKGTITSLPNANGTNANYTLNNNVPYQFEADSNPLNVGITGKPANATINFVNQTGDNTGSETVNGRAGDTVSPSQYPSGYVKPKPATTYHFNTAGTNPDMDNIVIHGATASDLNGSKEYNPTTPASDGSNTDPTTDPNNPLNPNSSKNNHDDEYNTDHGYATINVVQYINGKIVKEAAHVINENPNHSVGDHYSIDPDSNSLLPYGYKPSTTNTSLNGTIQPNGSLNNGTATFNYVVDPSMIKPIQVTFYNQDGATINIHTGDDSTTNDTEYISSNQLATLGPVGAQVNIMPFLTAPYGYSFATNETAKVTLQQPTRGLGTMRLSVQIPGKQDLANMAIDNDSAEANNDFDIAKNFLNQSAISGSVKNDINDDINTIANDSEAIHNDINGGYASEMNANDDFDNANIAYDLAYSEYANATSKYASSVASATANNIASGSASTASVKASTEAQDKENELRQEIKDTKAALQKSQNDSAKDNNSNQIRITGLKTKITKLQNKLTNTEKRDARNASSNNSIAKSQESGLQQQLANAENELKANQVNSQSTINSNQNRITALRTKITKLQEKLANTKKRDANSLTSTEAKDASVANSKESSLEQQLTNAKNELQANQSHSQSTISNNQSRIKALGTKITKLQKKLANTKKRDINSLASEKASATNNSSYANSMANSKESNLEQQIANMKLELQNDKKNDQSAIQDKQTRINVLATKITKLQKRLANTKKRNANSLASTEATNASIASSTNSLANSKESNLEQQITNAENELNTSQSTIKTTQNDMAQLRNKISKLQKTLANTKKRDANSLASVEAKNTSMANDTTKQSQQSVADKNASVKAKISSANKGLDNITSASISAFKSSSDSNLINTFTPTAKNQLAKDIQAINSAKGTNYSNTDTNANNATTASQANSLAQSAYANANNIIKTAKAVSSVDAQNNNSEIASARNTIINLANNKFFSNGNISKYTSDSSAMSSYSNAISKASSALKAFASNDTNSADASNALVDISNAQNAYNSASADTDVANAIASANATNNENSQQAISASESIAVSNAKKSIANDLASAQDIAKVSYIANDDGNVKGIKPTSNTTYHSSGVNGASAVVSADIQAITTAQNDMKSIGSTDVNQANKDLGQATAALDEAQQKKDSHVQYTIYLVDINDSPTHTLLGSKIINTATITGFIGEPENIKPQYEHAIPQGYSDAASGNTFIFTPQASGGTITDDSSNQPKAMPTFKGFRGFGLVANLSKSNTMPSTNSNVNPSHDAHYVNSDPTTYYGNVTIEIQTPTGQNVIAPVTTDAKGKQLTYTSTSHFGDPDTILDGDLLENSNQNNLSRFNKQANNDAYKANLNTSDIDSDPILEYKNHVINNDLNLSNKEAKQTIRHDLTLIYQTMSENNNNPITINYMVKGQTNPVGTQKFYGKYYYQSGSDVTKLNGFKLPTNYSLDNNQKTSYQFTDKPQVISINVKANQNTDTVYFYNVNNNDYVGQNVITGTNTYDLKNTSNIIPQGYQLVNTKGQTISDDELTINPNHYDNVEIKHVSSKANHDIPVAPTIVSDVITYSYKNKPIAVKHISGQVGTSVKNDVDNSNNMPNGYQPSGNSDSFNYSDKNGSKTITVEPINQSVTIHYQLSDGTSIGNSVRVPGNYGSNITPKVPAGYQAINGTNKPYTFTDKSDQTDVITVRPNDVSGTAHVNITYAIKMSDGTIKKISGKPYSVQFHGKVGDPDMIINPADYQPDNDDYNTSDNPYHINYANLANGNQDVTNANVPINFTYNAVEAPELLIRYDIVTENNNHNDSVIKHNISDNTYSASDLGIQPQDWVIGNTITLHNGNQKGTTNVIHAPYGYHLVENANGFNYQNGSDTITLEPITDKKTGKSFVSLAMPTIIRKNKPVTPAKPNKPANVIPAPTSSSNINPQPSSIAPTSTSASASSSVTSSATSTDTNPVISTPSSTTSNNDNTNSSSDVTILPSSNTSSNAQPTSANNTPQKNSNISSDTKTNSNTLTTNSAEPIKANDVDNIPSNNSVDSTPSTNSDNPLVSNDKSITFGSSEPVDNVATTPSIQSNSTNNNTTSKLPQTNEANNYVGIMTLVTSILGLGLAGIDVDKKHYLK